MVKRPNGRDVSNLVLFSFREGLWKVADFGLAMQGTSRSVHITTTARGTVCYRAPELVRESGNCYFNNKVDIWSLGCIMNELIRNQRAFADDVAVQNFDRAGINKPSFALSSSFLPVDDRSKCILSNLIEALLCPDFRYRPRADDVLALLDRLDATQTNATEVWLSGCDHVMRHQGAEAAAIAGTFPATVAGYYTN